MMGSGNAATVLCRCMLAAGHHMVQIFGRTAEHAKSLAVEMNCSYTTESGSIRIDADLYVLAIPDRELTEVCDWLSLDRKLVVHTAGSVGKEILSTVTTNYGILYPLQTLKKEIKNVPVIPFLVDGNTVEDLTLIYDFAKTLSQQVEVADDENRRQLHLAAVIVNNFTNHLYFLAQEFCEKQNISFQLLLPLIEETVVRLRHYPAKDLQTGPAARNDYNTLEKHLQLLEKHPSLKEIYQLITDSIQFSIKGKNK